METLQVILFGHVNVVHPHALTSLKLSRGIQSLLAYLLLHNHPVAREVLMDVFWMDASPDRARSSLTTALCRLRQTLEPEGIPHGAYLITGSAGEVGFNWQSDHWLDTKAFEQRIYPLLRRPTVEINDQDIREIEGVLTLYRGELLEGMYDDWALRERERFRSLHLNCLTRLMECYASRGEFEQSIALAHEILRRDPVREEIHRALMRIYLESGQRSLAVRQYIHCRDILDQELGVSPLEETQLLYQGICMHSQAGGRETAGLASSAEVAQLVHEMQMARQSLVEAARVLERINKSINSLARVDDPSSLATGSSRSQPVPPRL
jgi:DNA-binding SARP family transcriptional activator